MIYPGDCAACQDSAGDGAACQDSAGDGLSAKTLGRKQNHMDRLSRKPFNMQSSPDKKLQTFSSEAKYDGQPLQEAKFS